MDGQHKEINLVETYGKLKVFIGLLIIISSAILIGCLINFFFKYEKLNVHLVAHTHDDVGWLKTPEEYYENYVKYILNNVVWELQKFRNRRFVYVETYFFWHWWEEQTELTRKIVQGLIKNGQLEIIGGGWCMSDEAVVHYQSFIDQSTWGFRRLNDTLGPTACPTVAWQIDTFGHSTGFASLFAQMGFNSLFIARVDIDERKQLKSKKQMEFLWLGNENLGQSSSIFTSIFYDHYSAPMGFDFEMQSDDTPIDFAGFSQYVRNVAKYYRTDNILVPMGDDFRYFNARRYFSKIDKLISFFEINSNFKLNVFYSTPSDYVKSLKNANVKWSEKHGDFFPYASELHSYWSGYFTSRPTLKYFERISNNILQISKQLFVLAKTGMRFFEQLTSLREAVGVLQHHDAITGTSQQHVTDHYSKLLYEGIENCGKPIEEALGKLSAMTNNYPRPRYQSCLLLNISECEITETSSRFVVTVYNPLSRKVSNYIRIPVKGNYYTVRSGENVEIQSEVVPIPKFVRSIPGRKSIAKSEIVFKATNIPAMGFKSFYVSEITQPNRNVYINKNMGTKKVKLVFDATQLLSEIRTEEGYFSVSQAIRYYKSSHHWSGAYVFRPQEQMKFSPDARVITKLTYNGDLVKEYEQEFSSWASQVIRVYKDEDFVEFDWVVGPIPVHDYIGKEVILQYTTNIKSGSEFFTDVNGMEMKKRNKNIKTLKRKIIDSVAANYYPVTTMISVKDESNQMYVINDRAQGGSSLQSGEIELMVHRRLCYDDGKGVTEPLNELAHGVGLVARGRHWLLLGKKSLELSQKAKLHAQMRHSEPWLFFFDADYLSFDDWQSNYLTEFTGLLNYVPKNVRILTLEPWREDTILLRLEHIFEKIPNSFLGNVPEIINLQNLFKDFEVLEARETTLGANRWLSEVQKMTWETNKHIQQSTEKPNVDFGEDMRVILKPQQIRTFIVKIKPKTD